MRASTARCVTAALQRLCSQLMLFERLQQTVCSPSPVTPPPLRARNERELYHRLKLTDHSRDGGAHGLLQLGTHAPEWLQRKRVVIG